MWLVCRDNLVSLRSPKPDRPVGRMRLPLTVGELYRQVPGPAKDGHVFVINDEERCKAYPAHLFVWRT
jgi:hypothetical protein